MVAKNDLIIDMDCYLEDTIIIKSIFEARWEDKSITLFIPGTSVKGVLRHQCGHILHALGRGTAITVMNGALFADHPLRNTKGEKLTFPLYIRIKDCTDSEAGLAMLLVKDLMTGQVTMGANRTIGCGRIKGHSVTVKYKGERYVIDGTGTVTEGQVESLESLVHALHQSTDDKITAEEGAHE